MTDQGLGSAVCGQNWNGFGGLADPSKSSNAQRAYGQLRVALCPYIVRAISTRE